MQTLTPVGPEVQTVGSAALGSSRAAEGEEFEALGGVAER